MLAFVPTQELLPGEKPDTAMSSFDIFELLLDVLFCTDVVLNFCTAYVDRGVYQTRMSVCMCMCVCVRSCMCVLCFVQMVSGLRVLVRICDHM